MKKQLSRIGGAVIYVSALILTGGVFATEFRVNQNAPNAADTNPGTKEAPLKTISAAAKIVKPGDTVTVSPGIYRECVSLTVSGKEGAPITFQSEVPHKAVICGSDIITDFKDEGRGVWSFDAPELRPGLYQPDRWVYMDSCPLERIATRDRLTPGSFNLDCEGKRIYLMPEEGKDIRNVKVEFARREGLIRPFDMHANSKAKEDPLLDDIHIKGFTLIHNAGWARGRSALMMVGRRWIVENNRITWSSFQGINMKFCNGAVVRGNEISWCGDMGIGGGHNANLLIEENLVTCNNWQRIEPSWEGGGSKWVFTIDSRVRNNEWSYNLGPGVWFDAANGYCVIEDNLGHDNEWGGAFAEISWDFIFRGNVNFNNGAIEIAETPGTVVRRNISFNNTIGIRMRGDFRRWNDTEGGFGTDGGWQVSLDKSRERMEGIPGIDPMRLEQWSADYLKYWIAPRAQMLNNCVVWENLIFDNIVGYTEYRDYARSTDKDPFINNFSDYNIFWADDPSSLFKIGDYDGLEGWRKASGRDMHSVFANPRSPDTVLPDWAKAKSKYWETTYMPIAKLKELKLGLVPGPVSRVAIGRIMRYPDARQINLSDNRIKAFLIEIEGQKVLALWTTMAAERRYLRLKMPGNTATVENGYLRKEERPVVDGELDLVVSFLPTYVYGVKELVEEGSPLSLVAQPFNLPSEPVPVTATLANPGKSPIDITATFSATAGFKTEPAEIKRSLAPGEKIDLKTSLIPDGSMRKGAGQVKMNVRTSDKTISRLAIFTVGEGAGRIPHTANPISIDGSLDEWGDIVGKGVPVGLINDEKQFCNGDLKLWKGLKDLSAKIYSAWTTDALYVAVVVADDSIVSTPAILEPAPWFYDSVEVFVDGRSPEMQWEAARTNDTYQIGIGLGADDKSPPSTRIISGSPLIGYKIATRRMADGYIVELMIPLTPENFPAGGWKALRPIKFSVLINDKDDPAANSRKYVFGWSASPRGENFVDTSGWATLLLDEP